MNDRCLSTALECSGSGSRSLEDEFLCKWCHILELMKTYMMMDRRQASLAWRRRCKLVDDGHFFVAIAIVHVRSSSICLSPRSCKIVKLAVVVAIIREPGVNCLGNTSVKTGRFAKRVAGRMCSERPS